MRRIILSLQTAHLSPTPKLYEEGAILVNKNGQRFVNELEKPSLAIPKQPFRVCFILFDEIVAQKFAKWPNYISTAPGISYAYLPDYRRTRRDIFHKGKSLEALATKLGIPPANLLESAREYNQRVESQQEDAFGRQVFHGLTQPPFYALGPAKSWVVLTDGGLAITKEMEVLDKDNRVIPGLYAAGSTGQGGVLLEGHGMHLGWAFTSGRIAGRNAAKG